MLATKKASDQQGGLISLAPWRAKNQLSLHVSIKVPPFGFEGTVIQIFSLDAKGLQTGSAFIIIYNVTRAPISSCYVLILKYR